jgi:hypothetical protein
LELSSPKKRPFPASGLPGGYTSRCAFERPPMSASLPYTNCLRSSALRMLTRGKTELFTCGSSGDALITISRDSSASKCICISHGIFGLAGSCVHYGLRILVDEPREVSSRRCSRLRLKNCRHAILELRDYYLLCILTCIEESKQGTR